MKFIQLLTLNLLDQNMINLCHMYSVRPAICAGFILLADKIKLFEWKVCLRNSAGKGLKQMQVKFCKTNFMIFYWYISDEVLIHIYCTFLLNNIYCKLI